MLQRLVMRQPIRRDVKLSSLHDDLVLAERAPTTEVLHRSTGTPEELGVADAVEGGETLSFLRRLRCAGGDPLAFMTNYVPDRYRLDDDDLEQRGLYAVLRGQGVTFAIAHQTIGARLLTAEEAALLGETGPAACVTMERLVYDDAGRFVELRRHVYRATHYTVQTSLVV